ncbi:hypothetical protein BC332_30220 [Capsicum chinense]|nr:hypothetical protein BC332_30220 [Capsicum chinense]
MGNRKTVLQNLTAHLGWGGIFDFQAESGNKVSLSGKSSTNTLSQSQVYHDHPTACLSYPWANTYFGRLVATYGLNEIIYPQMLGVTSTRVALPLEYIEILPIYVNVKQYSSILKSRQFQSTLFPAFSSTLSTYWISRYSLSSRILIELVRNGREGNRQRTGQLKEGNARCISGLFCLAYYREERAASILRFVRVSTAHE